MNQKEIKKRINQIKKMLLKISLKKKMKKKKRKNQKKKGISISEVIIQGIKVILEEIET